MNADYSKLKRRRNLIPDWIMEAMQSRGVVKDFEERPLCQQNDYLGWIAQAKKQETKIKRLNQMLDELEAGGIYMKMKHPPSSKI